MKTSEQIALLVVAAFAGLLALAALGRQSEPPNAVPSCDDFLRELERLSGIPRTQESTERCKLAKAKAKPEDWQTAYRCLQRAQTMDDLRPLAPDCEDALRAILDDMFS